MSHEKELKMAKVKDWAIFEKLFIHVQVAVASASLRSGDNDCGSRSHDGPIESRGDCDTIVWVLTWRTWICRTCTGVPKNKNGTELALIFGGKKYRSSGDAEADKAAADMVRERSWTSSRKWQGHRSEVHSVPDQVRFHNNKIAAAVQTSLNQSFYLLFLIIQHFSGHILDFLYWCIDLYWGSSLRLVSY